LYLELMREYSLLDELVSHLDQGLRTVFGRPPRQRATPQPADIGDDLNDGERELAAGLMRVNHTGEVCAQALYQGQSLTARSTQVRQTMSDASAEENDHLAWCEERIEELGGHKSFLNPLWYAGSFTIGALAGLAGDRISLGFLAETERQVVRHLDGHLDRLPVNDTKSREIVERMREDELGHATTAVKAGAVELPDLVKKSMSVVSKIMTTTSERI
jgi:ubiquinone biosynthesis monooxygenase Coq7